MPLFLTVEGLNVWVNVIIAILTFIASYVIPTIIRTAKNHSTKKKLQDKRNATIDSLPERFDRLEKRQDEMEDNLQSQIQDVIEHQEQTDNNLEAFQIQTYKYQINDAYLSKDSIHEVPWETLIVASEACDIYKGKNLNHEIGARCDLIYEEIKRRERLRAEGVYEQ